MKRASLIQLLIGVCINIKFCCLYDCTSGGKTVVESNLYFCVSISIQLEVAKVSTTYDTGLTKCEIVLKMVAQFWNFKSARIQKSRIRSRRGLVGSVLAY